MKALTIKQPWAWAIAMGAKNIENRSRPTRHRGPLAVHAGAAWSKEGARDDVFLTHFRDYRYAHDIYRPLDPATYPHRFTFRQVIAVVDVVDCHPAAGCCKPWGFSDGFHWVLANAHMLDEPVPASGRLGLWDIDLADPRVDDAA